ncbi:1-acyl-sn-glycerol-3-phosphate acyltransferase [Psychroflexus sp. YR1-1]|uniref:1-acyl-sn-glycerol-3-phosphate acyltransferase n=1 Tax=Psychroflexus aurantiacus TaxID=2709310 RepID=A0A6B3QY79_9FLAO|nr:lysophospholipid acyltransferase family protein [Psychroflexus aurantiacus]NEV92712.1 1-acyl-sn-glycerol-3-phosphate acyltransferase [Psychroflexus aurantiacus]
MRWIKKVFIVVWRIWFYILVITPLIVLLPFLLITTSKEKWYPGTFFLGKIWAYLVLYGMGFIPKVTYKTRLEWSKSYMLTANHTSMIDIMMMIYVSKTPFVFIGKRELAKLPVFGLIYKRSCILVDRGNARSRKEAFEQAQRRLKSGVSICIFPEGGVPDDIHKILDQFKEGAFRLSIEHQIPIVPISFPDSKKRFRYGFDSGSPGVLRAVVHPLIQTQGMELNLQNRRLLKQKTAEAIRSELYW